MSTTDQALLQQIQYALLEAPDGGQAWSSGLWTRDEIVALCNQRQDRLLFDTLLLVSTASLSVAPGDELIALPTDWLRTVDAVWVGADGTIHTLHRADSFEADQALPTWETTPATPILYVDDDVAGSLQIRIAPVALAAGTIALLYVAAGTALTGSAVTLTVPDELAHAVKYGVLASALSKDGRGRDQARAAYAQQRVDLAEQAVSLILQGWRG